MEQQNHPDQFSGIDKSSRIAYLIAGYIARDLTIAEEEELDAWLVEPENMNLFLEITDEDQPMARDYLRWYQSIDVEKRLAETRKELGLPVKGKVKAAWKYLAAACVVALLIATVVYLYDGTKKEEDIVHQDGRPDIQPGAEFAQLKLATGEVVALRPGADTIISQSLRVRNGEVINSNSEGGSYELSIPRKAHFKLVLPDGSKVFLNAESSIKYPGAFAEKREVTVSGETYFEVAKDPNRPFIVSVNDIKVQALGTAFNIKAYENEAGIATTLTEGAIKISDDSNQAILKPGEQLTISNQQWSTRKNVDTAPIVAWTKNEFKFKNANIKEVMRMIERWYDAKVIYKTKEDFHFNGTISRDVPVSHLLELLEETGHVHFNIEGNEIIVSK